MRILAPFLAAILLFPLAALAGDPGPGPLPRAVTPDWVLPMAMPGVGDAKRDDAENGVLYLIYDVQRHWQGESRDTYRRIALKVMNRAGLEEAASIVTSYDPASETLALTRLRVIRGGQVIDHLGDARFEVYRRETQLDEGIVDGTLTAHAELADVRVGDIVDMGFLTRRTALFPGETRGGDVNLGFSTPTVRARLVLNWPAAWPFHSQSFHGDELIRSESAIPGGTRYIWERPDAPVLQRPPQVPEWYRLRAGVRYSDQRDWGWLAAALSEFYSTPRTLPPS